MTQQRQRDGRVDARENRQTNPGDGPPSQGTLERAAELLRAGDEAIEQVLSGDSVEFLAASQQLGGQ